MISRLEFARRARLRYLRSSSTSSMAKGSPRLLAQQDRNSRQRLRPLDAGLPPSEEEGGPPRSCSSRRSERRGKAEAVNLVMAESVGEYLVFVNADALPERGAFSKLLRGNRPRQVGGGDLREPRRLRRRAGSRRVWSS